MYTIYVHIFPNKKKYVGVTKEMLEKRFGKDGNGYRSSIMRSEISKYGWDNIKHKILETNLSYEEAIEKEQYYIKKYKSNNPKYGYNRNKGGGFAKEPKSYIHINTPNRQKWYNKQKGVPLKESTKIKIAQSHLKRYGRYICQYDNNKLIKKWQSACEIQRQLGFDKTHIGRCCNYNEINYPYKKAYKYVWLYEKREG